MKLLIVVSKLLTGFDAPSCTYLYIDKSMQDHGLFQAICRVNRLDGDDKDFGFIIDYKDLFKQVKDAVSVYTSELDYDGFEAKDVDILLQSRLKAGKERLDAALEEIALLCEPVPLPKDTLAFIHYFCGNPEIPEDLKAKEPQRNALYKQSISLIPAYANIADEIDLAGYSNYEIESIKVEINNYIKLREEIRKASGETLDMKTYEADMRYLIDTYIQAEEPVKISLFDEMPLLDIIEKIGINDAVNTLPDGIRKDQRAIAETIENNVRRKIITEHLIDPSFYENMSTLLAEIIKERKANALSYEEYLLKIANLVKQVNEGKADNTPKELKTQAQRALYNNLGKDVQLATLLDTAIIKSKRDGFRGNLAKEREVKSAIYNTLKNYSKSSDTITLGEPPEKYSLIPTVERIYKIIVEQKNDY